MLVYNLKDLSSTSSALNQFKDSRYLNLAVHYKNSKTVCSFLIPFNKIGDYFSTSDGTHYGTIKSLTKKAILEYKDIIGDTNPMAAFAVTAAAADHRYVRRIDGTDKGGDDKVHKFMITNDRGLIDKSFFDNNLTNILVGLAKLNDNTIVSRVTGDDISNFYKSRVNYPSESYLLSQITGDISSDVITKAIGIYVIGSADAPLTPELSGNLGTTRFSIPESNIDQIRGNEAYHRASASFGVDNYLLGTGVLISGNRNTAIGNYSIVSGESNISSAKSGLMIGNGNKDATGIYNVVSGYHNTINESSDIICSGDASIVTKSGNSLILSSASSLTNTYQVIYLGKNSTNTGSKYSLIISPNDTEQTSPTSLRSVVVTSKVKSTGSVIDSLLMLTGNSASTITNVTNSLLNATDSTFGAISNSSVFGGSITTKEGFSYSSVTSVSSSFTRTLFLNALVESSDLSDTKYSTVLGKGILLSTSENSIVSASGSESGKFAISNISTSVLTGLGESVIATAKSTLGSVDSSVLKEAYNSLVTLRTKSTVNAATTSVIVSDNSTVTSSVNSILAGVRSTIGNNTDSVLVGTGFTVTDAQSSFVIGVNSKIKSIHESIAVLNSTTNSTEVNISNSVLAGTNILHSKVTNSVLTGSNEVTNLIESEVIGKSNVVTAASSTSIHGNSNTVTNSFNSLIVGGSNSLVSITESLIIGSSNAVTAVSDSDSTKKGVYRVLGGSNNITPRNHEGNHLVFGESNTVSDGAINKLIGDNSSVTGSAASRIYVTGSNNTVTCSVTTNDTSIVTSVGSSNLIKYESKYKSINAYGTGLVFDQSTQSVSGAKYSDRVTLLGQYNDDLNGIPYKYGINDLFVNTVIGNGSSESFRSNALVSGTDGTNPFTLLPGTAYMESIQVRKWITAIRVGMLVSTGEDAPKPCRMLEYKFIEVNGKTYPVLRTNSGNSHYASFVMADSQYNKAAVSTYEATNLPKPSSTPAGVRWDIVELIMTGMVIVDSADNIEPGRPAAAYNETGMIGKADGGNDVYTYIAIAKDYPSSGKALIMLR